MEQIGLDTGCCYPPSCQQDQMHVMHLNYMSILIMAGLCISWLWNCSHILGWSWWTNSLSYTLLHMWLCYQGCKWMHGFVHLTHWQWWKCSILSLWQYITCTNCIYIMGPIIMKTKYWQTSWPVLCLFLNPFSFGISVILCLFDIGIISNKMPTHTQHKIGVSNVHNTNEEYYLFDTVSPL